MPDASTSGHVDPMAADRRVLAIGLVAVVVFVAIGVASASVFATSACRMLQTTEADADAGALDVQAPPAAFVDDLAALQDALGPLVALHAVSQVEALVEGAVTARLLVLGDEALLADHAGVGHARAEIGDGVRLVGDGDGLFALAWVNDLTGQVDALAPVGDDFTVGDCVDTAVVGSPFAFHLDAAGGDLLLFRVEEDAADPHVELRGPDGASAWTVDIPGPVAPPGILAERIVGAFGPSQVVIGRRVAPGDDAPALYGVVRDDGDVRWRLDGDDLRAAAGLDGPIAVAPQAVGGSYAVVAVASDAPVDAGAGSSTLLRVDLLDGAVAVLPMPSDAEIQAVASSDDGSLALLVDVEGGRLVRLVPEGVDTVVTFGTVGSSVMLPREQQVLTVDGDARLVDAVEVDGHVVVALRSGDDGVVAWFARAVAGDG